MKHRPISTFLKDIVSDRYAFFWEVPEGSFKIAAKAAARLQMAAGGQVDDTDRAAPFLVCRSTGKRYYAPLRTNRILHRTFSSINDDAGIVKFASSYGLLGFTRSHNVRRHDGRRGDRVLVESVRRWRHELDEIKRLLHLWDTVKARKHALLAALLMREDDGIYIILNRRRDLVAPAGSDLDRRWELKGEQPREAAMLYLTNCINDRLRGGIYPRALPDYKNRLYLFPDNLLTAMWLMFLWEVIGEVRPYTCASCNGWFALKRSTRKTCSAKCRKRLSRSKRKAPRGRERSVSP